MLGCFGSTFPFACRPLLLEVFESQDCCNQAAVSCVIRMCHFVASRQNVLANSILVLNSVQRRQKVELARERPGMSPCVHVPWPSLVQLWASSSATAEVSGQLSLRQGGQLGSQQGNQNKPGPKLEQVKFTVMPG